MSDNPNAAEPLVALKPNHEFFVGIDSDGCVFDSMEIKHKECFCPNIIKYWGLQSVSKYAREAVEFVNLYSEWRGINRWPALVMVLDLLRERPEVLRRNAQIPQVESLRAFIKSDYPKSNAGLEAYFKEFPNAELEHAMAWSLAVNRTVEDIVEGVPPFPYVRESLQALTDQADMIVVSGTPVEALKREWEEHDLAQYVSVIAGQEMGNKTQHLALAAKGKYEPDHILMIGDAPGDLRAAKSMDALFYPINPGAEEQSWERFYQEGMERFLNETYAGEYEQTLLAEFETLLPSVPPWKQEK